MTHTADNGAADLIDRLAGLAPGSATHTLRHQRETVAVATQRGYDALFDPALEGITLGERLCVACYAARLTPSATLLAHYRDALAAQSVDAAARAAIESGTAEDIAHLADKRLAAILTFTRTLIENPVAGDKAALHALPAAAADNACGGRARATDRVSFLSDAGRRGHSGARPNGARSMSDIIRSNGFTNETLGWDAWLDVVDVDHATPEQVTVLEESHPKAKVSDYYLFLVHQPEILRQRSAAFNAIMYAPGGLSRAERALSTTVVSSINGCVYCASVHAQRFEQLARRTDVIREVFDDPRTAGTSDREKAIAQFSIALTERPGQIDPADLRALRDVGLNDTEILDLIHSVAIFAWANRLMLNLGEPEFPADA